MENGLIDIILSLRTVRNFKTDQVEDEKISLILKAATSAPSSGNTQPWEFIVVTDFQLKKKIKSVISSTWRNHVINRLNEIDDKTRRVYDDATQLVENSENIPVIIFACLDLRKASKSEEAKFASIYPAVQNLLLAAHAIGLGTCLTTHGCTPSRGEKEVKSILCIPEYVKITALVFLGYPSKVLGPPKRHDLSTVVHINGW
ncbi:nitroreductase [Candidatus Nitrosarchaeum limnium SFB1]|jgi:nitroreductase|uniref:Nitroreductase n=1 Tax=Candidatus Nitrosarchaeum limnium SFB1 TaxID=886738 RepID=F3KKQ6_9ARCH|nr:nitroreductase [Candidatus Nitrosarchaeum limnium SFB1]